MAVNLTPFKWTKLSETVAREVAVGKKTDSQIYTPLGVPERTFYNWKEHPSFQARVAEHVATWREAVMSHGVADRARRTERANKTWIELQQVIAARAKRYKAARLRAAEHPKESALTEEETELLSAVGIVYSKDDFADCDHIPEEAETGLVILIETPTKMGVKKEWAVDTSLLAEIRNTEKQVAQDLGQWTEKTETTHKGTLGVDLSNSSDEDLAAMEKIIEQGMDTGSKE